MGCAVFPLLKKLLVLSLLAFAEGTPATPPFTVDGTVVGDFHPAAIDYFGVDGSVLIHVTLRRYMADIVLRGDFTNFKNDIRRTCARMQLQVRKYGGGSTISETQLLFFCFDGHRIDGKQANSLRSILRSEAKKKVYDALARGDAEEEIPKKDLSAAVGAFNITAMKEVQKILTEMGIPWAVAPVESEHQLIHWQKNGFLRAIFANDSDYILLGGKNVILDSKNNIFSYGCNIWLGPHVLSDPNMLTNLLRNPDTPAGDIDSAEDLDAAVTHLLSTTSGKGKTVPKTRKSIAEKEFAKKWHEVILIAGYRALEILRCVLKSDYNSFPNVGVKTAVAALHTIVSKKGFKLKNITTAELFEQMATILHPTVVGATSSKSVQSVKVSAATTPVATDATSAPMDTSSDTPPPPVMPAAPTSTGAVQGKSKSTISCTEMVYQMEQAWILYNYSVVASVDGMGKEGITTMNPLVQENFETCIKYHTKQDVLKLIDWDFFDFTKIDMSRWSRGCYDVATGILLDTITEPTPMDFSADSESSINIPVSASTSANNSTANLADAAMEPTLMDISTDLESSSVSTAATNPADSVSDCYDTLNCNVSPKYCNCKPSPITDDGFPRLEIIENMTGTELKDWIRKCGIPTPSDEKKKADLKILLRSHVITCQQHGLPISSSTPSVSDKAEWGKKVHDAYAHIKTDGWISCQDAADGTAPTLTHSVIDEYAEKVKVSSARVQKISWARFADHCSFLIDSAKRALFGGVPLCPAFVKVQVARSSTEHDRIVCIELLVNVKNNTTEAITSCICLPPDGLLGIDGNVISLSLAKDYKPCRSGDGRCSHCMTGLRFYADGGKNYSSTRELAYWKRTSTQKRDDQKR